MSKSNPRVALIGGGKMGRALVQGMLAAEFTTADLVAVGEPNEDSRKWWQDNTAVERISDDNTQVVADADIVLFAVKPNMLKDVVSSIAASTRGIIVSVAAGISLSALSDFANSSRVVRVMPNTPCLVGAGVSAYCCGDSIDNNEAALVNRMLSSVGLAIEVTDQQMDGVTGLSGSGPAYICLAIEALSDGGVLAGLPRDLATQLATQTVLGTAKLVKESALHPGQLKDAVASPGGTTIAGLASLEANGLRNAMISAVKAAADRSRELA